MMCVASDEKTDESEAIWSKGRLDKPAWDNIEYPQNYHGSEVDIGLMMEDEGCKKIVALVEAVALIAVPVLIVIISSVMLIFGLYRKMCSQSNVVKRSVETVVIMMLGFNFCVLPYCVTVPINPEIMGGEKMLVLIFLMHLHSAINPVIYLMRSSKFRRQAIVIGSEIMKSIDKRQRIKSIRRSLKSRSYNID